VLQLAGAAILLALFFVLQKTVRQPLMPLGIWRVPRLGSANLAMALLGAAWIPMWYFLNLYLQQVLGYGAFASGAALLPMTLLLMVFMTAITARLLARLGAKVLIGGGLLVLAAGLLWLSAVEPSGSFVIDVLPASLVAALGMSLAYIPAMMADVRRPRRAGRPGLRHRQHHLPDRLRPGPGRPHRPGHLPGCRQAR
jgi:hypothetical protein